MLQDRHILWNEAWKLADVEGMLRTTIAAFKGNSAFWTDAREDWENWFALQGLEYGVNPGWLLVCTQRERSLVGKDGEDKDFDFAAGVVGQDGPGTVNTGWNGFVSQITRAARITAWHGGIDWAPRRRGVEPSSLPRWRQDGINSVVLRDDKGDILPGIHLCNSRAELAQLRFTPHLKVLDANENLMRGLAPLFYQ